MGSLMSNPAAEWRSSLCPDKGGYCLRGWRVLKMVKVHQWTCSTPGIWTSGGITSFGGPAGEGMPMPPPGEPMDADDLFMMFAGPEGDFGPDGFPDDGPAAPGGFRGSLVVLLCLQDKTVILRTVTSVLMVVLKVV